MYFARNEPDEIFGWLLKFCLKLLVYERLHFQIARLLHNLIDIEGVLSEAVEGSEVLPSDSIELQREKWSIIHLVGRVDVRKELIDYSIGKDRDTCICSGKIAE